MIRDEEDLLQKIDAARKAGIPEAQIMARVQQELQGGGQQPTTPQQPERQGLLRQIGESIVKPFAETGRQIAGGAVELGRAGLSLSKDPRAQKIVGSYKNPFIGEEKYAEMQADPKKALLEQAKASAGVASWAVPGGAGLGQKVVRGGLAGGLAGLGQTKGVSAEELAKGFGKGALIGGVTAGALDVGGKVVGGVKGAVQKGGRAVAEKAAKAIHKATPAGFRKAVEQHGVSLNDLIRKYVQKGNSYDDLLGPIAKRGKGGTLGSSMNQAEDAIKSTVKAAGGSIRASGDDLVKALEVERRILKQTVGNETKIKALTKIIDESKKRFANGLSANQLLNLKRSADRKFGEAVVKEEIGSVVAQSQKILGNMARGKLKEMFPKIADALDNQTEIFTLRPILNHARSIAETRGSQIRTGTLEGGITSWLNPINLLEAALAKPERASKVLQLGGEAATTGAPGVVGQAAQRGLPPLAGMLGGEQQQQPGLPPIGGAAGQQPTGAEEPILSPEGQWRWNPQINDWEPNQQQTEQTGRLTQDQISQLAMQAMQSPDPKKALDIVSKLSGLMGPTEDKALTVESQKLTNLAKSGLRGLEEVRTIISEDPGVLTKQLVPGKFASRKFDSALTRTVEALLRARSGAAVPETEVQRYIESFGPRFGDTQDVVEFKLQQLEKDLNDMLGVQGTLPDINQLVAPY